MGSASRGLGRLPSLHPEGGWAEHPETRKAGGTHPTGMLSSFDFMNNVFFPS